MAFTNYNDVEWTGTQYGAFIRIYDALKDEHYVNIYQFRNEMVDAGMDWKLAHALTDEWVARNT